VPTSPATILSYQILFPDSRELGPEKSSLRTASTAIQNLSVVSLLAFRSPQFVTRAAHWFPSASTQNEHSIDQVAFASGTPWLYGCLGGVEFVKASSVGGSHGLRRKRACRACNR
jgi:hypothetical protein